MGLNDVVVHILDVGTHPWKGTISALGPASDIPAMRGEFHMSVVLMRQEFERPLRCQQLLVHQVSYTDSGLRR